MTEQPLPRRVAGASSLGPAPTPLVPLYVHPAEDPGAWDPASLQGATVIVNIHNGPGDGADPDYRAATRRLADAGIPMLGYVDLGYVARPLADLLGDVKRWTAYPVVGAFLDQAPTSPFGIGPVALAVRVARRAGLHATVLNPGTPPDPIYRELEAPVVVFEGGWDDYRDWSGEGARAGDGHLIHGVPVAQLDEARRLMGWRGAGFGLVTERELPAPWAGLPHDRARVLAFAS
jgi:hypothetical protein